MNNNANQKQNPHKTLTRREFLQLAGVTAGALLVGCGPQASPVAPTPTMSAPATVAPTATPSAPATVAPTPTRSAPATVAPTFTTSAPATGAKKAQVAIAQAQTYDPQGLYDKIRDMLDSLGGLGDIVRPGARVAIKINLTGGSYWEGQTQGLPGVETFVTHPEVVRALGKLVLDAGAKALYIVEAVYEWESYTVWGYDDVAKELGATLIDLNATDPYPDFATLPVPGGGKLYDEFTFNRILEEIDTFMSVSKMKCHWVAGVTHTMKNLIGLVPLQVYRAKGQDTYRSKFHGANDETAGERVPQIITDLNRARPLHFGLVDGIKTTAGGEGPWIAGVQPVAPGVLLAGKDVVATDAVATAAMGFDPTAADKTIPFIRGRNYIQLANDLGLGTNRLEEIAVLGPSIQEVTTKFRAALG
ncbi:MAG TPA: DUF362 domain-containing protein [Anaerolineae bacterium]|nr:DUF362 domain-containing protein [Anaerolineae bacterium]HQH37029.1 DUF362 domain-containing protein [Anaerolineae bacterium]